MRKQGRTLKILWWVYIDLLFVFVVFKFKGSSFRSMSAQIERITQWWALKNLLGNIISFIPFGFLLPVTYKKFSSAISVFVIGFASILLIESFQFFTKLGSFDVDDKYDRDCLRACDFFGHISPFCKKMISLLVN